MKKIMKIIGGFVAVIFLIVIAAFYFTSELPKTADKFFIAVKSKNMDQAYSYVSDGFKQAVSQDVLQKFLQSNGFDDYQKASWSSRKVENSTGKLVGYILTSAGKELPLNIDFIKLQNEWKINAINKPTAGIQTPKQTAQMPVEKDLISLVRKTMASFAESINHKITA